jgi:hypothetical protein
MARSSKLLGLAAMLALASGAARAENLDAGKSAPALFAATCQTCHSSPRGLSKDRGSGGLTSYLQEHYTSSPQSAAALAAYLIANPGNPRGKQGPVVRNPSAPEEGVRRQGEAKEERQSRAPHSTTTRPDSMVEPEQKRANTESPKARGKRQQTKQEAPGAPAARSAEPAVPAPAAAAAPPAPAAAAPAAPVAAAPPAQDPSAFSAPSP